MERDEVKVVNMRALIQRVTEAKVMVGDDVVGAIEKGLLILIGITHDDGAAEAAYLARKITKLRLFEDAEGKMNRSLVDVGGAILAVSQFTLYGDVRKGRRPSFTRAAPADVAEPLYRRFCALLESEGAIVRQGVYQAHMQIHLVNDGPVSLWLDTVNLMKTGQ